MSELDLIDDRMREFLDKTKTLFCAITKDNNLTQEFLTSSAKELVEISENIDDLIQKSDIFSLKNEELDELLIKEQEKKERALDEYQQLRKILGIVILFKKKERKFLF